MREIFTDSDLSRVGIFQSVLEEAGIPCFIRNESSHNIVGGALGPAFYPVLCITKDEDYERAIATLAPFQEQDGAKEDIEWQCPECGEQVPGSFDSCWNCEAVRPSADGGR